VLARLAVLSLCVGCVGSIDPGLGAPPTDPATAADPVVPPPAGQVPGAPGDPSVPRAGTAQCVVDEPAAEKIHRLTRYEYMNTLQSLFGAAILNDPEVVQDLDGLSKDMTDAHPDPYTVQSDQALAFFQIALRIGGLLVTDATLRGSVLPACTAVDPPAATCLADVLRSLGEKAYRRPLAQPEIDFHTKIYSDAPGATADRLQVFYASLLTVPAFLYHVENDGAFVAGRTDLHAVTDWALAARLSYGLWGTMPDKALFDLARAGGLSDDATLRAQVARMIDDPKAKLHLVTLLSNWLDTEKSVEFVLPDAFLAGVATSGVRQAMKSELDDYLKYVVWEAGGGYRDLLTSDVSIVKNATLAKIYGVTPDAAGRVRLSPGERKGVLGKGMVLNKVGRIDTSVPIKRGVFVYRQFLCQTVTRPDQVTLPPGSLDPIPLSPDLSIRDAVVARTGQGVCDTCHSAFNPFGFMLGSFDALGRYQTTESIFDRNGKLLKKVPVDAAATVKLDGQSVTLNGEPQLADYLADAPAAARCFAQRSFEQIAQRALRTPDGCAHQRMLSGLTGTEGSIRGMFAAAFTDRNVRLRKVGN
jgi:hypothetical protein